MVRADRGWIERLKYSSQLLLNSILQRLSKNLILKLKKVDSPCSLLS